MAWHNASQCQLVLGHLQAQWWQQIWEVDSVSNSCLTGIGIPIVEIRRPAMEFHMLVRQHLYIESGTRYVSWDVNIKCWVAGENSPCWRQDICRPGISDEFTCHIDGLVQDCSNSNALAMELLQSYTKPSIYERSIGHWNFFALQYWGMIKKRHVII